MVLSILIVLMM